MDLLPDEQWGQMKNLMDKNHDGQISLKEYEDFSNDQQGNQGDHEAQMEQGLVALDLNHNGCLLYTSPSPRD